MLKVSPSGKFWSFPLSSLCLYPATFLQCTGSSVETCPEAAKEKQDWLGGDRVVVPRQEAEGPSSRDLNLPLPTGFMVRSCWGQGTATGKLPGLGALRLPRFSGHGALVWLLNTWAAQT